MMVGKYQLRVEAARFGIRLSEKQLAQFETYQKLLLGWNQRINLTAITDPAVIPIRHFLDSLTCAMVTGDLSGQSLIDVGTGAGFPGLPLKILFPNLKLTLVESVGKKGDFLKAVSAELGMTDVAVVVERAEAIGQDPAYREQFDWAVARAVAALPVLAEYLLPLCRVGGHMLALKGENAQQETAEGAAAIELLGGGEARLREIQLAGVENLHYLVLVEKLQFTDKKYPRRIGVPGKRPIA